jgi:eukaryotic-like serine/threonine-protein kinase
MRYRLIERLGVGGMAEVWRGFDEVLGRHVAVKFGAGLRAEVVAEAQFSHPNVVNIYDYGQWSDGRPFLVMELIEGKTLSSVLNGGQCLPWRRAVSLTAQIASALAAAHAVGIVHRDVSTGNIMLTPNGARLLDFGISAPAGEPEPLPDSGDLQGTPAFMAPERLHGAEVTPAADVYALGVLFYRALTGRLPWAVQTRAELLDAHLWLEPAPLPAIAGLPQAARRLCLQCLEKEPADRPSSVELAATLGPLAGGEVIVPAAAVTAQRPHAALADEDTAILLPPKRLRVTEMLRVRAAPRRARFAWAMVGLLGIAALGLFAWTRPDAKRPGASSPPAPDPTQAGQPCRVTYDQQTGTGNRFSAVVTVHNDGPQPVKPWQVEFAWPGDQTVLDARGAQASQQGRQVVLRPEAGGEQLGAGSAVAFSLNGEYGRANALPDRFTLAGSSCETVIMGSPPAGGGVDVVDPAPDPPVGQNARGGEGADRDEDQGGGNHGGGKHGGHDKGGKHRGKG